MNTSTTPTWPSPLTFEPDASSKRKKGAQRPKFSPVWTLPAHPRSPPQRIHLFVNPYSGRKKGVAVSEHVVKQLTAAGLAVEVHLSQSAGQLVMLARSIESEEGDVFAVVGGDGSLSEVIDLFRFENQC